MPNNYTAFENFTSLITFVNSFHMYIIPYDIIPAAAVAYLFINISLSSKGISLSFETKLLIIPISKVFNRWYIRI